MIRFICWALLGVMAVGFCEDSFSGELQAEYNGKVFKGYNLITQKGKLLPAFNKAKLVFKFSEDENKLEDLVGKNVTVVGHHGFRSFEEYIYVTKVKR